MRKKVDKSRIVISILLWMIAITVVLPLFYMLMTSSKTMYEYIADPLGLPDAIIMDNYIAMFSGYSMATYFRNSILVSFVATLITLMSTIPAAYTIAKTGFRWNKPLYLSILALMMVPGMVMLIPRYIMFSKYHLIDNLFSLILAYSVGAIPFSLYLLVANFKSIPNEMVEACKIDGASYIRTLLSVIIPMGKPAIITVCIINFVNFWNETVQAILFINKDELRTVTAVVANMGDRFMSNIPMIMTGLMMASVPTIILYILFERNLEAGITMGSSK